MWDHTCGVKIRQRWETDSRQLVLAVSAAGVAVSAAGAGSVCSWYRQCLQLVPAVSAAGTGSVCSWYRQCLQLALTNGVWRQLSAVEGSALLPALY